jgi:adenylate kinase
MVRWNLAAVVGVPGVGKTSLCQHASQSMGYHYVNYGELMLQVSIKQEIASTQDEMFKLPLDVQHKIWRKAAEDIKGRENVLVDLHGLDKSTEGYLISLPVEILTPQIIILIESSYDTILKRRISDHNKKRPKEDIGEIKKHIGLLRVSMATCSAILGSNFAILENEDFNRSLKKLESYL